MEPYSSPTDLFAEEPVAYAGFWERFGAAFLDGIIMYAVSFAIELILSLDEDDISGRLGISFISIAINWLYYALQESSPGQATLGKKALGLKVTSMTGERISFGQATGRYFGRILSGIILLIGYLMMLWDDKKQTLHDKLAGTLVIKAKQ